MGINPANWIDLGALLKSIFNWIYSKIFATEIAQRDKDETATKAEVKGQLQLVKDDAKQVAAVEIQKQAVEQQIQVEQQKQAADAGKIQEVQRAKEAKDVAIDDQSAMDAFDAIHRPRP